MIKHFCVAVHVYNPETRRFLLVKHKKLGKWIQPGGHIEENEDPEEAAIRETLEETGINVRLVGENYPRPEDFIKPLALQKNIIKANEHIHIDIVYLAVPTDNQSLVLNEKETEGVKWFDINEILEEDFETFDHLKVWSNWILKNY